MLENAEVEKLADRRSEASFTNAASVLLSEFCNSSETDNRADVIRSDKFNTEINEEGDMPSEYDFSGDGKELSVLISVSDN